MENTTFIPATQLPEAEGDEVSVLCLENGEMKQKPAKGLGGGVTRYYGAYLYDENVGSTTISLFKDNVARDSAIASADPSSPEIVPFEELKAAYNSGIVLFDSMNQYNEHSNGMMLGFFIYGYAMNLTIAEKGTVRNCPTSYPVPDEN